MKISEIKVSSLGMILSYAPITKAVFSTCVKVFRPQLVLASYSWMFTVIMGVRMRQTEKSGKQRNAGTGGEYEKQRLHKSGANIKTLLMHIWADNVLPYCIQIRSITLLKHIAPNIRYDLRATLRLLDKMCWLKENNTILAVCRKLVQQKFIVPQHIDSTAQAVSIFDKARRYGNNKFAREMCQNITILDLLMRKAIVDNDVMLFLNIDEFVNITSLRVLIRSVSWTRMAMLRNCEFVGLMIKNGYQIDRETRHNANQPQELEYQYQYRAPNSRSRRQHQDHGSSIQIRKMIKAMHPYNFDVKSVYELHIDLICQFINDEYLNDKESILAEVMHHRYDQRWGIGEEYQGPAECDSAELEEKFGVLARASTIEQLHGAIQKLDDYHGSEKYAAILLSLLA